MKCDGLHLALVITGSSNTSVSRLALESWGCNYSGGDDISSHPLPRGLNNNGCDDPLLPPPAQVTPHG